MHPKVLDNKKNKTRNTSKLLQKADFEAGKAGAAEKCTGRRRWSQGSGVR